MFSGEQIDIFHDTDDSDIQEIGKKVMQYPFVVKKSVWSTNPSHQGKGETDRKSVV